MKDYSGTKSSEFILYFEEKENTIIVYFADGSKVTAPNTDENRRSLIERMENQKIEKPVEIDIHWVTKMCAYILPIAINNYIDALLNNTYVLFFLSLLTLHVTNAVQFISTKMRNNLLKEDYEKTMLYKNNKELFDKINLEEIKKIESNCSQAIINKIKKHSDDRQIFDINSIENYSLEELKEIKSNMEKLKIVNEFLNFKDPNEVYLDDLMKKYDGVVEEKTKEQQKKLGTISQ